MHRLVSRGEPGVSCDVDGVALGPTRLVIIDRTAVGASARVVDIDELALVLERAYRIQSPELVTRCARGLRRAAAALEAHDVGLASMEVLMLGLPPVANDSVERLVGCDALQKLNDHWEDEPRVPKGESGAGRWTTGGGTAAPTEAAAPRSQEVNPETIDEVANRTYHDEVVAKAARILRAQGCTVVTEIPLLALDGMSARADILAMTPTGQLLLIEVKTGVYWKFEDTQRIIYPMATLGGHVLTFDPRIVEFGFEPGERLPAMEFYTAYKRDKTTRLVFLDPGELEVKIEGGD